MRTATKQESVHDRRAKDLLAAGQYVPLEVVDPYDPQSKITVLRQTRGDTLGWMHAHHQIDDAQYLAGRRYERDRELADRGARAIDPTKEAVDGGGIVEPLPDSQIQAVARLTQVHVALGRVMQTTLDGVLMAGTVESMALQVFKRNGARWVNHYGKVFRDSLDVLVVEYGMQGKLTGNKRRYIEPA